MEEKFETLWLRYKRPIFGYLLAHACQPADAEDLLQIVAYKALKNFSSLRNPAKFYSWIFAIAKHVVADYHRTAVPESVFTCIITKSRRIWRKNYICVFLRYPNTCID